MMDQSAPAQKSYRGTMPIPVLMHDESGQSVPVSQPNAVFVPPHVSSSDTQSLDPVSTQSISSSTDPVLNSVDTSFQPTKISGPGSQAVQAYATGDSLEQAISPTTDLEGGPDYTVQPTPSTVEAHRSHRFSGRLLIMTGLSVLLIGGFVSALIFGIGKSGNQTGTGGPTAESSLLSVDKNQTLTINGQLSVSQASSLQTLTVGGPASFNQGATITGDVTVSGNVSASSFTQNGNDVCDSSNNCAPQGVISLNNLAGGITLQGSPDQIDVNTGGATITLSTPQDIATTSSPSFAGLTLGTALSLSSGGTGAATALGARTNLGAADSSAAFLTIGNTGVLSGERALTIGTNLQFSDGGANGIYTLSTVADPTFGSSVTTPQLSLTGSGGTASLVVGNIGQDTIYILPDSGTATATICLDTGNCPGSGGGGSGTVSSPGGNFGRIAKFTGAQTIADSSLSETGSAVTASGTLTVQGANSLTLGTASTNSGAILLKNSTNTNTLTLQSGVSSSNLTFTLPTADGGNGACLQTDGAGTLSFQTCTGGAGGGVTSLNGLTGIISLANATASGSTVTIDNASTSAKGIAQFNASNFSVSSGVVNTIQNITTTSTPQFSGVTLGAASTTVGSVALKNATNTNTLTLRSGATASNLTFTLPTSDGSNGACLETNGSGVLSFQACTGGAGGGVTSINGLTGILTLANASGSGSTLTINNASTSAKGIAQFNSTNFAVASGVVTTIQDIATSSSPQFTGLSLTSLGSPDSLSYLCRNTSNQIATCNTTGSGAFFAQGGNSFGANAVLGTNDTNALIFRTDGSTRLTLSTTGNLTYAAGSGTFDQSASSGTFATGTGSVSLNGSTTVAAAKTLTVTSGLTTLTGASSGNALVVSNSTSTGNIAVFNDNSSAVLTIADGGGVTGTGTYTFSGPSTDITTGSNEDLTLLANGTGVINLNDTVKVGTLGGFTASSAALCRDSSTAMLVLCDASNPTGKAVLIGGNFVTSGMSIGTLTNIPLSLMTSGTSRLDIDAVGAVSILGSLSVGTDLTVSNGTITLNSTGSNPTNIGNSSSTTTITGPTNINTSGSSNTAIGFNGSSGVVSLQGGLRIDGSSNLETLGYTDTPYGGFGSYNNLLIRSDAFGNTSDWIDTNVSAPTTDTVVAPDGNQTAETLADSASGGSVSQTTTTVPTNNSYTFSVWLKASSNHSADLRIDGSTSGTGTKATVNVTTTWQRFYVTQNTNGFTGFIKVLIFPGGTGASGSVDAWGAQLIQSSNPGVYVRTTAAAATTSGQGVVSNGGGYFVAQNASTISLVVQGFSGQTADLFEVQNNGGTPLLAVTASGSLIVGGPGSGTQILQTAARSASGGLALSIHPGDVTTCGACTGANLLLSGGTESETNATGGSIYIDAGVGGSGGSNGDINIGTSNQYGTLNLGTFTTAASSTQVINIGNSATGSGRTRINIGTTNSTSFTRISVGSGSSGGDFVVDGTNASVYNIGGSTTIGSMTIGGTSQSGSITLGQSTAGQTINIGHNTVANGNTQTIQIGDSAAGTGKNLVTIGSTNAASALTLQAGTGDLSITTQGTGTLGIGNNGVAQNIAVGNATGATAVNVRVGTGNYTLDGAASSAYTIGSSTTTGTVTIGGSAQTGNMTLGSSSGTNSVLIGNGTGATTVNISNANTAGAVNVGTSFTTGTFTLGGSSQTGTITLGQSTASNTINIGAAAGFGNTQTINIGYNASPAAFSATTVNIGSTVSGAVLIQGGTGSSAVGIQATALGTISIGSTAGTTINIGTGAFGHTINVGTDNTTSQQISLGSTTSGSTVTIQGGNSAGTRVSIQAEAGTIGIGTTTTNALNINIGTNGNGARTIQIGNTGANATATTVNIATSSNTSALQAVTIGSNAAAGHTTLIQGGNSSTAIQIIPNDSGAILIGGASQTGDITVGQSTDNQTLNIGTGATASGKTLTIHIGDAGASGSTTNITIGSSVAGTLTVKSSATFNKTLTVGGHIIGTNTSGTTTVSANTAVCGTGCTVTISGNDTSGIITVNTGTGVTAGTLGTITFASAYGAAPMVVLTPETVPGSSNFPQYHYSSGTTTFDLKSYNALTDSVTYKFSYHIIQ